MCKQTSVFPQQSNPPKRASCESMLKSVEFLLEMTIDREKELQINLDNSRTVPVLPELIGKVIDETTELKNKVSELLAVSRQHIPQHAESFHEQLTNI